MLLSSALARPFRGGHATLNGAPLYREAVLKPGDLLGLGSHFLFLYRDPRVTPVPPLALPPPWQGDIPTSFGPGGMTDRQEMLRLYLGSTESLLRYQAKHADALLQVNTDRISSTCRKTNTSACQYTTLLSKYSRLRLNCFF